MALLNPFENGGQWFKANLHAHTTTSDGDIALEELVRLYRKEGYSVLTVTDHDLTNDIDACSTEGFLLIQGIETCQPCPGRAEPYHLVAINIPRDFRLSPEADINDCIEQVKRAGGEAILPHPYWSGLDLNHLTAVEGCIGTEVYNAATQNGIGRGISSVHWDMLLESGVGIPAIACDDTHSAEDLFKGWTMIRAEELSTNAIMEALRTGCYYASCGPVIEDLRVSSREISLRCSPVAEVHFMSQRQKGRVFQAEEKSALTEVTYQLSDDLTYVRVEMIDHKGMRGWTNPLVWR